MLFFVPGIPDDEAAAAWERMRQACGASVDTRPLYSISYDGEGTEFAVTVGEEGVVAIVAGQPLFIFEAASRRPVPWQSVTEMVFFDEG
jgi:hypothetical protein